MKRSIIIERPDGLIPGFREVNDRLAELDLCLIFAVDLDDKEAPGKFIEMYLVPATP